MARYPRRVLYHVPPDGGLPRARPLHGGPARASETAELRQDLVVHGFSADAPVIWLSPGPVARAGLAYAVDQDDLDPARLLPTFSSGGYMLYVGDLPEGSFRRSNENRHQRRLRYAREREADKRKQQQRIDAFHGHLDGCERCRSNPFDLCPVGQSLLETAGGRAVTRAEAEGEA